MAASELEFTREGPVLSLSRVRNRVTLREVCAVPSEIILAHTDAIFLATTSSAIATLGRKVAVFDNSMAALMALEADGLARLLITGVSFPPGQPNGVSLATVAARHRPGLRVLFVCDTGDREYTDPVGSFLPATVSPEEIARTAHDLLSRESV